MIICVPVTPTGDIDLRWGRAARVAIAEAGAAGLTRWEEFPVAWDALHDGGTEGGHHARIAGFLREHGTQVVLAHHMGDPMARMLLQMGLDVRLGASGDARRAVLLAAADARP